MSVGRPFAFFAPLCAQYFESRGGKFPEICFFGLQYFIKRYLCGPVVTQEKIDEAADILAWHMGPDHFNREGWEYILKEHGGRLVRATASPNLRRCGEACTESYDPEGIARLDAAG